MKYIFKKDYVRVTTDNKWVLVYVLTVFMAGLLTAGVFIKSYSYFTSINKPQALLSPLDGLESLVVGKVYANEIPDSQSLLHKLYLYVRWNESNNGTKGLAVTCRSKGKINQVGYILYKGYCFNSREEQEITVKQWFSKRITIQGLSPREALIVYTGGADYAFRFGK